MLTCTTIKIKEARYFVTLCTSAMSECLRLSTWNVTVSYLKRLKAALFPIKVYIGKVLITVIAK